MIFTLHMVIFSIQIQYKHTIYQIAFVDKEEILCMEVALARSALRGTEHMQPLETSSGKNYRKAINTHAYLFVFLLKMSK